MANDQKARIDIEAAVSGLKTIDELTGELEKAGGSVDALRDQASELDAGFRKLEQQQKLISELGAVEAGLKGTQQALTLAKEKQKALSDEVVASLSATKQQVAEQKQAESALVKLGSQLDQQRDKQRALTERVIAAKEPNAALTESHQKATDRLSSLTRQYELAQDRVRKATEAVQAGSQPTAELTQRHERATTALEKLTAKAQGEEFVLKQLQTTLQANGIAAGTAEKANASLAAEFGKLQAQSAKTDASLRAQVQPVRDLQAAFKTLNVQPFKDVQREVEGVRAALAKLEVANRSGAVSTRELAKAKVEAAQKIRELQQSTNGIVETLGQARTALTVFAASVAGTGLAFNKTLQDYRAFEAEIAKISTLVDEVPAALGDLAEQVQQLGAEFGKAPTEEARALYEIISSGAGDAAEATTLLTAANKLAIGGVTDVKTAADGLTSVIAAYGLSVGEATSVSDALFVAAADGKTTIDELSRSIGQVAPIAAQSGVGLDELLSGISTLTKGGVKTAEAITSLRGVITAVIQPSKEATDTAKALGLEFDAQALRTKGLAGFLQDVRDKTQGNVEQNALLFGRVEALNGVLTLTGKQADSFANSLDNMTRKAGETEEAFNKVASTDDFQFKQLGAEFDIVQTKIGSLVSTALVPLAEAMTTVLKAFNEAPVAVQAATAILIGVVPSLIAFTGTLRAIGGALTLIGAQAAGTAFSSLVTGVDKAGGAVGRASTAVGLLSGGLISLASAAVLAALASVGFAFVRIKGAIDDVAEAQRQLTAAQEQARQKAEELDAEVAQRLESNRQFADAAILSNEKLRELSAQQQAQYFEALGGAQRYYQALELQDKALGDSVGAQQAAAKVRELGAAIDQAQKSLSAPAFKTAGDLLLADFGRLTAGAQDIGKALEELSGKQLNDFIERNRSGFLLAQEDVGQLGKVVAQLRDEQFKRLGIDTEAVLTGIDAKTRELLTTFSNVGATASTDVRLIQAAFDELLKKLDTPKELEALKASLAGVKSPAFDAAAAVGEVEKKLKDVEAAADKAKKELEEAFKTLGITSTAALQTMEEKAKAAFDLVRAQFGAFSREAAQGFQAYADAALKAAASQGNIALEAELASLRITAAGFDQIRQLDDLANKYREKGDAAENSADRAINANQQEVRSLQQVGEAARRARIEKESLTNDPDRINNLSDLNVAAASINGRGAVGAGFEGIERLRGIEAEIQQNIQDGTLQLDQIRSQQIQSARDVAVARALIANGQGKAAALGTVTGSDAQQARSLSQDLTRQIAALNTEISNFLSRPPAPAPSPTPGPSPSPAPSPVPAPVPRQTPPLSAERTVRVELVFARQVFPFSTDPLTADSFLRALATAQGSST